MDVFSSAELTSCWGNTQKDKENQQFDLHNAAVGQDEVIVCAGWACERMEREEEWQGLRSKQEECRYHSSNYCFINGPRVAGNEYLHQSVLTALSLARHSRSCPQSVDFKLAQKLVIRFRRNLVICWMCWRSGRGLCCTQLKLTPPALSKNTHNARVLHMHIEC